MGDLEWFMHDESVPYPALIKRARHMRMIIEEDASRVGQAGREGVDDASMCYTSENV
jgi:hypothetical protein